MLKRVYIEITNVCNLACAFCPGTQRPPAFMAPADFARVLRRLKGVTEHIYLHVMGEPLLHPELPALLSLAAEGRFNVYVTTNGTLLGEKGAALLAAPAVRKVSVSLHSMEGNGAAALTGYLETVWAFARSAPAAGIICALRLWNLGGAEERNGEILAFLEDKLGAHPLRLPQPRRGSWRLGERLYLEQAEPFDWPDLGAAEQGTRFCLALRDQAAVLVDGTVAPCCLDHEGDIPLGNLFDTPMEEILAAPRARALYDGFSRGKPSEALCRRCGFARRFG